MVVVFLRSFVQVFYSPRKLYQDIIGQRRRESWICLALYGFIYLLGTLWLASHGARPFTPPWLSLAPERYYLIESIYMLPLLLVCWITASGIIYVFGGLLGGKGTFEGTMSVTGYALWAPWYPLIVLDIVNSVPDWLYNAFVGLLVAFWLFQVGTAAHYCMKLRPLHSAAVSVVTSGVTGLLLFTYIR